MHKTFTDQTISLKVGAEAISLRLKTVNHAVATILFLHGAGNSNGARVSYLTTPLAQRGISSAAIDFSGHGVSTGKLEESSLLKRSLEAKDAASILSGPIAVCGSSMGAHIAIKLLESTLVGTLILFCPAVYASEAYGVQFNKGFSQLIRQPRSWRGSDTFTVLGHFTGILLIVVGALDDVIPPDLPKMLYEAAERVRRKEIMTIPKANHKLHAWLQDHPEDAERVIDKIVEYVEPGRSA
jgi:pimeloyl-ACP methyl ester carboxylesterase